MAQLTNAQILTKYNDSSTGLFKDQTNREIVPNRPRSLTTDLTDSFFNKLNDAYSGAKGQRAGVTAPASLKDIVTTTLSLGVMITFTDSTASNVVRIYELTNETTAESSPTVIRPNDYATTTNERVWRLRVTADVDSDTGGGGGVSAWGDLTGTVTDQTDLVTYVDGQIDAAIAGLKWKDAVRVATTGAGTLATSFENGDTVDGVVLATNDRILLKNQADQTANGIYTVNASGAPTRATDSDTAVELEGATVSVLEGTANANTTWVQTTDAINLGVSNIVFTQFGTSVPAADASTAGIAKLYPSTSLGTNTDGAPTQNAAKVYADTALALKTDALVTYRTLTADHTLDSTDLASVNAGVSLVIEENQAIANDVTVPANTSVAFPVGTVITVMQMGAGLTSIIADGGVTIQASAGHLNSPGQYSPMILVKKATDTWRLFNGLPSSVAAVQDFSSSLTPVGFSSVSVQRGYYSDDGQIVHMTVEISGTSNNTAFQFSVPIALDGTVYSANGFMEVLFIQNVGAGAAGRYYASGSGTLVSINATVAGGNFTASGTKACKLSFFWFK